MEDNVIAIIIQGGAVGLAAYSMWSLNKIVGNHLSHATAAMTELTVAIEKLNQLINDKIK
jgi:hypothetical protein